MLGEKGCPESSSRIQGICEYEHLNHLNIGNMMSMYFFCTLRSGDRAEKLVSPLVCDLKLEKSRRTLIFVDLEVFQHVGNTVHTSSRQTARWF